MARPSRSERFSPVVFDLDGTLVDSFDDLAVAVNAALAHFGHRELSPEVVKGFVGNGARLLVGRSLGASLGRDADADVEEARAAVAARDLERLGESWVSYCSLRAL